MIDTQPTTLRIGMKVIDNDIRTIFGPNRIMVIHAFEKGRAVLRYPDPRFSKAGETRVAVGRIHLDMKSRKTGWSLHHG